MLKGLLSLIIITIPVLCLAMDGEVCINIDDTNFENLRSSIDSNVWNLMEPNCDRDLGCRLYCQENHQNGDLIFDIERTLLTTGYSLDSTYNRLWYGFKYVRGSEIKIRANEILLMLAIAANIRYRSGFNFMGPITNAWLENMIWLENNLSPKYLVENTICEFKNTYPYCKRIYFFAPILPISSQINIVIKI